MSRKYRQQGYQEKERKPDQTRSTRSHVSREGPRSPRMPGMQTIIRCALCGKPLPRSMDEIELHSRCPNCSADLHSCKNCTFFNPASRFECTQPIEQRIAPKDKRADCEYFEIRSTVEKITTSSSGSSPADARSAFEDLFKK